MFKDVEVLLHNHSCSCYWCQKKSVKELSAIVVNAEPTMNLEPSTLYVFLPEEHNLAPWNTKVLFKIRSSVRGTIKGIRGNLEEWNILQCTWGLFHISKMCKGSHRMVREWGENLHFPFQRRSGPQSSISWFPEVIIQVAFHDRLAWIVPHLSIKKLDEKNLVEDSQNTDIASELKRRFCYRLRYWLEVSRKPFEWRISDVLKI